MLQRLSAYFYLIGVAVAVTVNWKVLARAVAHHPQEGDSLVLHKVVAFVVAAFIVIFALLREKWKRSASSHGNAGRAPSVSTLDKLKWLYSSGGASLARRPIAATTVLLLIFAVPTALFLLTHPGGFKSIDVEGWALLGVLELPGLLVLTVIVAGLCSHKQRLS